MYYLSNTISRLPEAPICAISTKKTAGAFQPRQFRIIRYQQQC